MKKRISIISFTIILTIVLSIPAPIISDIDNDGDMLYHVIVGKQALWEDRYVDDNGLNLSYIGRNITVLRGVKLFYEPIAVYKNMNGSLIGYPIGDYMGRGLEDILYHYLVKQGYSCGDLVSDGRYYNDIYDVLIINATYTYCNVTITSYGYISLTYMDGVVDTLYVLNETELKDMLKYLRDAVYINMYVLVNILLGINIETSIVYAGVSADIVTGEHRQEFVYVNNTLSPVTNVYVRFTNPYYKFYIMFGDIRFAYPIIIGIENRDGKPILKFLKIILLPSGSAAPYDVFKINDTYLDLIVSKIRDILNDTSISPEDIVIADIYYGITPDFKYIYPYLKEYVNKTYTGLSNLFIFKLTNTTPVLENILTIAGSPKPSDPSYYYMDLLVKNMLYFSHKFTPKPCCTREIDLTPVLIMGLAGLTISIILTVESFIKRRRKR